MIQVVVDASLAIKWVIPEVHQTEALSLIATWNADGVDVIAPGWFACEIANVLFQRMRRGDLNLSDAQLALGAIVAKVRSRDVEPAVAMRAMEIASLFGLRASYDAQYLALAEQFGCELWTADDKFWNTVKTVYPRVKWVGQAQILSIPPESDPAT
jgi:predicted nucleic acid-binding protein